MLEDAHSLEMVLQMLYAVHSKDRENEGMASGFGGEIGGERGILRLKLTVSLSLRQLFFYSIIR
jgi:hypothetical protein